MYIHFSFFSDRLNLKPLFFCLLFAGQVTDFGISRPEMIRPHSPNVRGTIGYLDPEYMSTKTFTKKSDVYSFGVLLFELITGRNPQQGLLDYVKLVRTVSMWVEWCASAWIQYIRMHLM